MGAPLDNARFSFANPIVEPGPCGRAIHVPNQLRISLCPWCTGHQTHYSKLVHCTQDSVPQESTGSWQPTKSVATRWATGHQPLYSVGPLATTRSFLKSLSDDALPR